MMKRIRQFFRAVFAEVSENDKAFLEHNLDKGQQALFFGMSVPDQCHALRTAHTALALAESGTENVDFQLLARCALLHDVGRKKGDLGTLGKSFAVLFDAVLPGFARACGEGKGGGAIARKMRVYYRHPEIGAKLLSGLGYERESEIVRKHHTPPAENDPPELRILRMADEMN